MERIDLVDIDLNSFNNDEKRASFITMDIIMKDMHKKNKMITSFRPQDICYDKETSLFYFDKVEDINPRVANSKEGAIRDNIIGLSTLAFCSYLKTYDPKNGLLNNGVISDQFEDFKDMFDEDDIEYYRSVLVDSYKKKELPDTPYYSDYILTKSHSKNANTNTRSLVKSTEAGRLMTDRDEAAFGNIFYMSCMVAATVIAVVGIILYIVNSI